MDDLSPEQRHRVMHKIKGKDTKAEIVLRKALWKEGYRYYKNYRGLPGKPDIVISKYHLCIFVDGEFFHGKGWEEDGRDRALKGNNPEYWVPKIERNIQRDREVDIELVGMGWKVLRFWSRDVLKSPESCVDAVRETIFEDKLEASGIFVGKSQASDYK